MRTFEQISLNYDWDGYHSSCHVYTRISHPALALEWFHYLCVVLCTYFEPTFVVRGATPPVIILCVFLLQSHIFFCFGRPGRHVDLN